MVDRIEHGAPDCGATISTMSTKPNTDCAQQRQQVHLLIDVLPEEKLSAVHTLLEVLVEPLSRALAVAPVEDEDLTTETAAALDHARASFARGEAVSHEDVLREFGS
jgi:hypothetical protein